MPDGIKIARYEWISTNVTCLTALHYAKSRSDVTLVEIRHSSTLRIP